MNILFVVAISFLFSIVAMADEVDKKIVPTTKLSKEYIKQICEFVEYREFKVALAVIDKDGYKLENVYDQIKCKRSIPTLFHFMVDKPSKYLLTMYNLMSYFDQRKLDDKNFDYGKILNITQSAIINNKHYTATLLDRINSKLPELNSVSQGKLNKFKELMIKRGALTVKQLKKHPN